jgi:hypothetical protein
MYQDVVSIEMEKWDQNRFIPSQQIWHMLALYPWVIQNKKQYSLMKGEFAQHEKVGIDQCVYSAVIHAGMSDYPVNYSMREKAAMYGLTVSQLLLPHDNRRDWIMDQLVHVYNPWDVSQEMLETFIASAPTVITVALDDDRIIAASLSKLSEEQNGFWKYVNVLGVAYEPYYEKIGICQIIWREMVRNMATVLFVS